MRCGCWTWSAAPGAWTRRTGGAAPRGCMQRAAARYVRGCPSARTSERRAREQGATGARASRAARQGEDRQRRRSTARPPWLHPRPRPTSPRRRRRGAPAAVAGSGGVSGDGPGPLPAGEVVGSSGHLDVCVRRYDVVGAPSAGTASEKSVAPLHCWGWARAARHPPPPLPLPPCLASSRPSHRRCGFTKGGHPKAGPGHYQCQPHRGGGRGDGTGTGGGAGMAGGTAVVTDGVARQNMR